MKILNNELLNELTEQAIINPRLRMNYNLHDSPDSKSQRLFNALEPGTILPIHRHMNTSETYILLRGSLKIYQYTENHELKSTVELNLKNGVFGIDIQAGEWHTVEILESGTVIFEVKDGPYTPLNEENVLVGSR